MESSGHLFARPLRGSFSGFLRRGGEGDPEVEMDLVYVEHDLLEHFSCKVLTFVERHAVESLAYGPGELGEATKNTPGSAKPALLFLEGVEICRQVVHPLGYLSGSFFERLLLDEPALVGVPQSLSLGLNS